MRFCRQSFLKKSSVTLTKAALFIFQNRRKCVWGGKSGSRELLDRRNDEIRLAYSNGEDILSLSERYCLCEDSIRKILKKNRAG